MSTTLFLAQLIGIFFTTAGLSMVLRRRMLMEVFREIFKHRALSYMWGASTLFVGIILVLVHHTWNNGLETVVSLLGWYLFIESLVYLFFSENVMKRFLKYLQDKHFYYLIGCGYFLLGTYLVFEGFILNI